MTTITLPVSGTVLTLPTPGGDFGIWGAEMNVIVAAIVAEFGDVSTTPTTVPNVTLPTFDPGTITGMSEFIRDTIGDTLVGGTGVGISVSDPGNTITIGQNISFSGLVVAQFNTGTSLWPLRATVTSSASQRVLWLGPNSNRVLFTTGYAIAGTDLFAGY